jgi:hypothetical protein
VSGQARIPVWNLPAPIQWGGLDLPLLGLSRDGHGTPITPAAAFSLATDTRHFWFLAHHPAPANHHPTAQPGSFTPELWKYDVAECFIANPDGSYLELNLAPNSAWWACWFSAPRTPESSLPKPIPEVKTYSDTAADGAWLAAMAVPLDAFGPTGPDWSKLRINVCFILGGNQRTHLSAANLPGAVPDFHQPFHFPPACHIDPPPA